MNEIQQSGFIYAVIMLVAGIGIPIMAALNAELGIKLQSAGVASSILFLVGLLGSLIYLFAVEETIPSFSNIDVNQHLIITEGNKDYEAFIASK